eukprot:m51a1_g1692 hypothetical protein (660) ;mRNA; r:470311-472873
MADWSPQQMLGAEGSLLMYDDAGADESPLDFGADAHAAIVDPLGLGALGGAPVVAENTVGTSPSDAALADYAAAAPALLMPQANVVVHAPPPMRVVPPPPAPASGVAAATATATMAAPPYDRVIADSPNTGVRAPPMYDASPLATKCLHCQERLVDMQESGGMQCQAGARRWEANWRAPNAPSCFGACSAREFCTDHGYPLPTCTAIHPQGTRHTVMTYRGTWVLMRAKHERGMDNSPEEADEAPKKRRAKPAVSSPEEDYTMPPSAPPEPAPGRCAECIKRLDKLRAVDWMQTPELQQRIAEMKSASTSNCQGFCQTSYCCKLHVFPTDVRKEGHPTRFKCPMMHDLTKKGRHHECFAYYCGNPDCCDGRWFSREETHRRSRRPKAHQAGLGDEQMAFDPTQNAAADGKPTPTQNSLRRGGRQQLGDDDGECDRDDDYDSAADDDSERSSSSTSNAEVEVHDNSKYDQKAQDGKRRKGVQAMHVADNITDNSAFEAAKSLVRLRRVSLVLGGVLMFVIVALLAATITLAVRAQPNQRTAEFCYGTFKTGDTTTKSDTCTRCRATNQGLSDGAGWYECGNKETGVAMLVRMDDGRFDRVLEYTTFYGGKQSSTSDKGKGPFALPLAVSGPVTSGTEATSWHVSFYAYRTSALSSWIASH